MTVSAVLTSAAERPAERQYVRGIVRDSASLEGIPYASVRAGSASVLADETGIFGLSVEPAADSLIAVSQGYSQKSVPLWTTSLNLYDIILAPQPTELRELVVGKARYSKRNNPAVDFVNRLRNSDADTDPARLPNYNYDRYERIVLGLNDYDANKQSAFNRRFPFLAEHVDTSDITGKPVLTMAVNEQYSGVHYRNGVRREMVEAMRQRGVNEVIDASNMQTVLSDALREVDLFQPDITILRNSFVSPLSPLGPDCYRYYLVDSVAIDGDTCAVLAFYPRGHIGNSFTGHLYVSGDSVLSVRRVEMRNRPDAPLNIVDALYIVQSFDVGPGGVRLKRSDDLALQMTVIPGSPSIYAGRNISLYNHNFESSLADSLFSAVGNMHIAPEALHRDDAYWDALTRSPESTGVSRVGLLMQRLRSNKVYYWGELIISRMFTGYWPTGRNSKFDFGPLNTAVSYNALEGVRLRAGGMTTANLSKHWFGRGYLAYGFRDRKWKYSGEVEYSFIEKDYHSREFPVHSIKLRHSYDVDRIGANYIFTSPDNFVLSLTRMAARMDTYRRLSMLEYILELRNNFSLTASVEHVRQEPSPYVPFATADGRSLTHYSQAALNIELRYAPGEKYYQMRTGRMPVNLEAPVFTVRHRFSPAGFLGSRYTINRTEVNFSKRFNLSVAGKLDVAVGGGHIWSSTPFPELFIPNANLSYTIQLQSYALMTPMEFMNTTYGSLFLTYHMEGLILNHIPLVRKAGLREIVAFNALWGRRSGRSNPGPAHPGLLLFPADAPGRSMDSGPYMEISVGLDNIFRCLRFQYYWRLSYRHADYPINTNGPRIALSMMF